MKQTGRRDDAPTRLFRSVAAVRIAYEQRSAFTRTAQVMVFGMEPVAPGLSVAVGFTGGPAVRLRRMRLTLATCR